MSFSNLMPFSVSFSKNSCNCSRFTHPIANIPYVAMSGVRFTFSIISNTFCKFEVIRKKINKNKKEKQFKKNALLQYSLP